jgi:hypothetical protein
MLADARRAAQADSVLDVELWVSEWLGEAWVNAAIGEREPEHALRMEVIGRATNRPSERGLAAVAAMRRVAPDTAHRLLDGTIDILSEGQRRPPWLGAPGWTPSRAWRAVDVWDTDRVLFVEYEGPQPHTLMAAVTTVGGSMVDTLAVLEPGIAAAWAGLREDGVPMPVSEQPAAEVLADLADVLRSTDMYWPRHNDQGFVALRALAWSRCRAYLPERPAWDGWDQPHEEGHGRLIDEFVQASGLPDNDVTRSLADLFIDYGEGYIVAGPLAWSPDWVVTFLSDWLPRKVTLDARQRAGLPEALRRWLRFALQRRGVDPEWIEPVVATVDDCLPELEDAFDNEAAWGPAKHITAALAARGVDLTDRQAVDDAIRELNAERLADRLLDGPE